MYTYYTDPPSVSIQTTLLQMKIGSQFNLTCQFDGNPTPNITWFINGSTLNTCQPRLSVSVSGNLQGTITDIKQCVEGHWLLLLSWKQLDWITSHK